MPIARRALTLLLLGATTVAVAADQQVLGRKLLVKDPTGLEQNRVVVVLGRERPSPVGLVGNPAASGASLQIVANGTNGSTQQLSLDAAGWTPTAIGFSYRGPTTGDPVQRVILRLGPNGATLKAVLKGSTGTTDLGVTPPNSGDDGGLVLAIGGGGDRYCVSFGGAAGGTEIHDDASEWQIVGTTAKPGCPTSPSITTTSTSSTTSSTLGPTCGETAPACDGTCPPSYHCESVASACFCFTGGTDLCTTCDTPCTGGDVCTPAVDPTPPYSATCECVTPPVCGTGVCGGNCPVSASCIDLSPPSGACSCYYF